MVERVILWDSRKNKTFRRADLFRLRVLPQKKGSFQTLAPTHHTTICHTLEAKVQFKVIQKNQRDATVKIY